MTNPTTIELPRIEGESARAYAARVEYVTMGAGRSLERLVERAQSAPKARLTQRLATLKEWSAQYGWVDSARQYDEQVSYLTIQDAADKHRADLEDHRKKAMDAGRSLYGVAGQMLQQLNVALANPRQIKGEDGKVYVLHGIEMTSATLTTVARALTMALDLSAHALGVDTVLGGETQD